MVMCSECRGIFDENELETKQEILGEAWGQPAIQEFDCCPNCGGTNFEETRTCLLCNEEFAYSHEDYCPECRKDTISKLNQLISKTFSDVEIDLLVKAERIGDCYAR